MSETNPGMNPEIANEQMRVELTQTLKDNLDRYGTGRTEYTKNPADIEKLIDSLMAMRGSMENLPDQIQEIEVEQ